MLRRIFRPHGRPFLFWLRALPIMCTADNVCTARALARRERSAAVVGEAALQRRNPLITVPIITRRSSGAGGGSSGVAGAASAVAQRNGPAATAGGGPVASGDQQLGADGVPDVADCAVVPGVRRLRDQPGRTEHAPATARRGRPDDAAAAAQDRGRQPEPAAGTAARIHRHTGQLRPAQAEEL